MDSSIFRGVPTNAQLLLYLHRNAERTSVPLSRPPPPPGAKSDENAELQDTSMAPEASDEDVPPANAPTIGGDTADSSDASKHPPKHRLLNKAKGTIVSGVRSLAKKGATAGADVAVEAPYDVKEHQDEKILKAAVKNFKNELPPPDGQFQSFRIRDHIVPQD